MYHNFARQFQEVNSAKFHELDGFLGLFDLFEPDFLIQWK